MKFFLVIALIHIAQASSSSDLPDAADCAPFLAAASNDMRNCVEQNPNFDLSALSQKSNETFMQETNDFERQKQFVQHGCDLIQTLIECGRNYRESVPATCLGPKILEADLLREEFYVKMHKYFCMDGLKNSLKVLQNNGVQTFSRSPFLEQCIEPAGDLRLYILEENRQCRNQDFCSNSKQAFDCLHQLFETTPNQNINIVLSEAYGIIREIMNCDNELRK